MKIGNWKLEIDSGFTLLELLIVIAILAVIGIISLILLNPMQQIGKAWDAKRKADLATLRKVFEDYYNDKGCYPQPNQVCYNIDPLNPTPPFSYSHGFGFNKTVESWGCYICDKQPPNNPDFSPYLSQLPCDPQHPQQDYLYQVDAQSGNCPTWYRIYDNLSVTADPESSKIGCTSSGCGPRNPPAPTPPWGYSYGVSSSNMGFETSNQFSCFFTTGCNQCTPSTYNGCLSSPNCNHSKIYSSKSACCLANGCQ